MSVMIHSITCSTGLTDGSHQNQDLRNRCDARGLLVLRTQGAGYVRASLPECSHDNNPAEAVAVHERLNKMRNSADAEEDREEYGGGEAGRVLPKGIASVGGNVAMRGRSCI
jgi:hypothetical protein